MKTLAQRMEKGGGHTTGFDYMRLILALGVMGWHSLQVCIGTPAMTQFFSQPVGIFSFVILPIFFALSGFLVAASLMRVKSIWVFMGLRGIRILPALCMETFLSALVLGPLLTAMKLGSYFTHSEFYQYFLNCVGYVHYFLPGVFMDNPVPHSMNNSLWTVPFELECYIALFLLAVAGIAKRPRILLFGLVALSLALICYKFGKTELDIVRPNATGRQLVLFFLGGVTVYMWKDKLPHNVLVFCCCLVLTIIFLRSDRLIYLTILPVGYITAYLGLFSPQKIPVAFSGDYSYGIYLYAFPIQQTVAYLLPEYRVWYLNFIISLVPVCLFAAFSWHCVEKPLLKLKRKLIPARARNAAAAAQAG